MAAFGNSLFSRDAFQGTLPRLYKFSVILTANEQLARALLRGTGRSLGSRQKPGGGERDHLIEGLCCMYSLWTGKLTEDPSLQQKNAPDTRLFAGSASKTPLAGNPHFAKFITNLPSQQRSVLYLVYGEGVSYDEAAEIMSLNMLALMKLLARGHLALAYWLDYRGLAEGSSKEEISLHFGPSGPAGPSERAA